MKKKILIIGAGPGGYVAAVRAAQRGGDVTLVEEKAVGGTCLNRGCIPSKIMKIAAEHFERIQRAHTFGIHVNGTVTFDISAHNNHKEKVVENQVKGIQRLLHHHHIRYFNGRGVITGPNKCRVVFPDHHALDVPWDGLILATGTRPLELPDLPFDGDRILSSDHILSLDEIPGRIAIVGGGVIGCEFAFILNALGVKVTVIEARSRILPQPFVDQSCSVIIQREMKKRKIGFRPDHQIKSVAEEKQHLSILTGASDIECEKSDPHQGVDVLIVDKVLVCVGREPLTRDMGLENIGIELDSHGWIIADDRMETRTNGVFAIGDVLGPSRVMLAHVASMEGDVAAENLMGGNRKMTYDAVPSGIFTMPEVANVGLTEQQAKAQGIDYRSDTILFRNLGKAQVMDDIAGEIKMISETGNGRILGIHITGPQATDLISEGTLAIKSGLSVQALAGTIHGHPTLSEGMMEVAFKAAGKALHE